MELDANTKLIPINEMFDNTKMIVYMLYNKITKKAYVGKTKNGWQVRRKTYEYDIKNLKKQSLILRTLRKHGWANFQIAVLHQNIPDLNLLSETEKFYIKKYNTSVTGYNMTTGGDGGCSQSAARSNRERMNLHVKNGTFILQDPNIKLKAKQGASEHAKKLYSMGMSNLQKPEVKIRAIESCKKPCTLQVIRDSKTVFKKTYNAKKEILKDGFPLNIIQQLYKRNNYYLIDFIPYNRGPIKIYKKGDIITLKYL